MSGAEASFAISVFLACAVEAVEAFTTRVRSPLETPKPRD